MTRRLAGLVGLAGAVISLAACGRLNRTATLNQSTPGPAAALVLARQLTLQGHPGATVRCGKTLIVNVGVTYSCALSGAGPYSSVRFTFYSDNGKIKLSSVRAR